ncbi:hypothetical protein [Frigoriglobus tundricola]|uniref:DUF1499 domain-containing protein n=1 Tax=Frigoriglobus tundricola TaxID=2774151 RepID=A0A6M5YW94_9BACT|nr:hypothetical protein [Frigoriglobus tundricola]QJW97770.1 hypothetical protein FTUN_5348 [Frigoriglobus tundricola]
MAFGFPAFHTERYTLWEAHLDAHELAVEAILALRWTITDESDDTIRASTGISLWSWGERVTVRFRTGKTLIITSRCAIPTQCFDWGKNRSNVNAFLNRLEKLSSPADRDLR